MGDIQVKDSKIHGKGIFALRDFKKGETVLKWDTSHQLTAEQVMKLPESEKHYVVYTGEHFFLIQSPERFINHSCNHNTSTQILEFCDVAIRDIKKGEEITANYAEDLPPGFEMKCTCGSKSCKGVIKGV